MGNLIKGIVSKIKDTNRPVLKEIMEACLESFIMYDVIKGNYTLKTKASSDYFILERILGKGRVTSKNGVINLSQFVNAIFSIYSSISRDDRALLEAYFGRKITTRGEIKKWEKERFKYILSQCKSEVLHWPEILLEELDPSSKENTHKIYGRLSQQCKKNNELDHEKWDDIKNLVDGVIKFIEEGKPVIKLPIFAERCLRDPHGLDIGKKNFNLLIYIFEKLSPVSFSLQSKKKEDIIEYLAEHNIYTDYITSYVTIYGLIEQLKSGDDSAWRTMTDRGETTNLSLANILFLDGIETPGKVLLIENPPVFEWLCSKVDTSKVALVCTSGHFKVAGLKLMDMIVKTNPDVKLYYSGDFDIGGITMADILVKRYGDQIDLSMYAPPIYHANYCEKTLDASAMRKKINSCDERLYGTIEAIANKEKRAFQESFVETILELTNTF